MTTAVIATAEVAHINFELIDLCSSREVLSTLLRAFLLQDTARVIRRPAAKPRTNRGAFARKFRDTCFVRENYSRANCLRAGAAYAFACGGEILRCHRICLGESLPLAIAKSDYWTQCSFGCFWSVILLLLLC